MNEYTVTLGGEALTALPSGALWWAREATLIVSDLHLGKSDRFARTSGLLLPPYETSDTLQRLERDITVRDARRVVCLGDSFDDPAASADITPEVRDWIARLQADRDWIWVEGNHDPGVLGLGGSYRGEWRAGALILRHIAVPQASGELSGHYHPKAQVGGRSHPCFLADAARIILPAYGTYTGGLRCTSEPLATLMGPDAIAVLTGKACIPVPMPRRARV